MRGSRCGFVNNIYTKVPEKYEILFARNYVWTNFHNPEKLFIRSPLFLHDILSVGLNSVYCRGYFCL